MKKLLGLWLILIALSLILISCGTYRSGGPLSPSGGVTAPTSPGTGGTTGGTSSATVKINPFLGLGGKKISGCSLIKDGQLLFDATFTYTSGNYPSKAIVNSYNNGVLSMSTEANYDSLGNTVSAVVKDASGVQIGSMNTVISGGKVTRLNVYDASNNLTGYITYQYDSVGNITREDKYDGAGNLHDTVLTNYDSLGRTTRMEQISGGVSQGVVNIIYDPSGNPFSYSYSGNYTVKISKNSAGYITKFESFNNGVLVHYTDYTYNSSWMPLTMTSYDSSGTVTSTNNVTYNAAGKPVLVNGTFMSSTNSTTFAYDTFGNLTNTLSYDNWMTPTTMETVINWN